MTSKHTDPYSKTSTFKNPNPNQPAEKKSNNNPNQPAEKKSKNNPNQPAEKKSKKKSPSPDRDPNPNRSPSEEKKSKKKKSRTFTENPNPKPPSPSTPKRDMSTAPDSAASKKRKADEDDSIKILDAVIAFQKENGGANPTPTNMRPLFDSLKGRLQADLAGHDQLYNRIRHLRQKYYRAKETTGGAASSSLYDEKFLERSARAWAGAPQRKTAAVTNGNASKKLKPTPTTPAGENGVTIKDDEKDGDEEMEDAAEGSGGESFKFVAHQAREYWAMAGLPVETLEMGLKSMDPNKARALERKCAQHLEGTLKLQAKEFELGKELYLALIAAQKASAN